ncbi:MAG TPA: hypothetical protein VGF13_05495, partial [Verrucomicrobiae bacterium]
AFDYNDLSFSFTNTVSEPSVRATINIHTAIELTWQSESGILYQVQTTDDLDADTPQWKNVGDPVTGDGTLQSVFATTRNPQKRFYRLLKSQ